MKTAYRRRLIGVIDLMGGVAVRAIGGRRDEYRPVVSRLCDSPDPLRIANAYRASYGIDTLYVADLDAILGRPPNSETLARLVGAKFRVAVDAGLRSADAAKELFDIGVDAAVAGLETLPGPAALADLIRARGPTRVIFSLDLADGIPLGDPVAWGASRWDKDHPFALACRAAELGMKRILVLDLRSVGTSAGPTTADLCRDIAGALPDVRLWSGGGIRNFADLARLVHEGVDGVLVASALHDGTL